VALRDELVQVDVHELVGSNEQQDGYERPALSSTARRLSGVSPDFGASLSSGAAQAA